MCCPALPAPPAARRFGQAGGIPRRLCPILTSLREEVTDGQYTLVREERMLSACLHCSRLRSPALQAHLAVLGSHLSELVARYKAAP